MRVEEGGASECYPVMGWIGVALTVARSPHAKAGRLPHGLSSQERLANRSRRQSRCQLRKLVRLPTWYRDGTTLIGVLSITTCVGSKHVLWRARKRASIPAESQTLPPVG